MVYKREDYVLVKNDKGKSFFGNCKGCDLFKRKECLVFNQDEFNCGSTTIFRKKQYPDNSLMKAGLKACIACGQEVYRKGLCEKCWREEHE